MNAPTKRMPKTPTYSSNLAENFSSALINFSSSMKSFFLAPAFMVYVPSRPPPAFPPMETGKSSASTMEESIGAKSAMWAMAASLWTPVAKTPARAAALNGPMKARCCHTANRAMKAMNAPSFERRRIGIITADFWLSEKQLKAEKTAGKDMSVLNILKRSSNFKEFKGMFSFWDHDLCSCWITKAASQSGWSSCKHHAQFWTKTFSQEAISKHAALRETIVSPCLWSFP